MKPSDILYIIFPVIGNLETNYKLRKRLNTNSDQEGEQLQTPLKQSSNPDAITIESLKEQYADALEVKDKFEDKAKATIGCVTVSVTLILEASGLLTSLAGRFNYPLVCWLSYALFLYAVLSMIAAAIMDIKVIVNENIVFTFPADCPEEKARETYDVCVGQNITQNYIRNNYVFSAYECIRNALISLFVIMAIAVIPVDFGTVGLSSSTENAQRGYSYFETALYSLEQHDVSEIKEIIDNSLPSMQTEDGQTYSVVDKAHGLFIKFQINGNDINVLSIEEISWEQ